MIDRFNQILNKLNSIPLMSFLPGSRRSDGSIPSATLVYRSRCGNRLCCWNTMDTGRSATGKACSSLLSSTIRPRRADRKPAIRLSRVDLPEPLGPIRLNTSPKPHLPEWFAWEFRYLRKAAKSSAISLCLRICNWEPSRSN